MDAISGPLMAMLWEARRENRAWLSIGAERADQRGKPGMWVSGKTTRSALPECEASRMRERVLERVALLLLPVGILLVEVAGIAGVAG
jgi:hypothetical protein